LLLLFDLDGTLLPDSKTHLDAFALSLKNLFGIDAKTSEIEFPGKTDRLVLVELAKIHGIDESETRSKMNALIEFMVTYVKEHISEEEIRPLPGVVRLLGTLSSRGAELGVVTGSFEPIAFNKLEKAGISSYFHSGIGGFGTDSEDRTEMIRIALSKARQKIGTHFSAFYVGDTPRDVRAGHSANLRVVAVATGPFSPEELEESGADLAMPDLSDQNKFIRFVSP